jgi:uncharacterized protein YsxB (DUF464 family)
MITSQPLPKISVKIFKNKASEMVGFEVLGHTATHVCNAVSMLTINAVNSIEELTDAGCTYDYDNKDYINFKLDNTNDRGVKAGVLLDSLLLGFRQLEELYPTNLLITESDVIL